MTIEHLALTSVVRGQTQLMAKRVGNTAGPSEYDVKCEKVPKYL